jgi:hypothetical protein
MASGLTSGPRPPRPVTDGLGEVGGTQVLRAIQVGQGAGDPEDAVRGADREAELLERLVEKALASAVEAAVAVQGVRRHRGIDRVGVRRRRSEQPVLPGLPRSAR